jgi:hypothetical protein
MNKLDLTTYHIYLITVLTYDFIFNSINSNCRAKYGFTIIDQIKISSQDLLGGGLTSHHVSCINTPLVLLRIKNDSCLLCGAVMEFPCLGIEGVHIWFSVACWERQLGGRWPQ